MTWRDRAIEAARQAYPREACGLVVVTNGKVRYWPCRNIAEGDEHFAIEPEDYAAADDAGEIIGVFHSHPDAGAEPSEPDLAGCEASGLTWHIFGMAGGAWREVEPSGYKAPLVGRQFQHGTMDCYTLIRDWYAQERGVTLPDYKRSQDWWHKGENLYLDNFQSAGFVEVSQGIEVGDILLMQIESPVPNHAGIYVGDDTILHHLQGRLSSRDLWDGLLRSKTVKVLRYAAGNQALR